MTAPLASKQEKCVLANPLAASGYQAIFPCIKFMKSKTLNPKKHVKSIWSGDSQIIFFAIILTDQLLRRSTITRNSFPTGTKRNSRWSHRVWFGQVIEPVSQGRVAENGCFFLVDLAAVVAESEEGGVLFI